MVQPVQLAFQQQIQALKTQHEEFVSSLKQQPQSAPVAPPLASAEPDKPLPMAAPAGENKHLGYTKYVNCKLWSFQLGLKK